MVKNGPWHHNSTNLVGLLGAVAVVNGIGSFFFNDLAKVIVLAVTVAIVAWAVYQMTVNKKAEQDV